MRKNLVSFILLMVCFCSQVNAESYFSNNNNVDMSESEYKYISKLYYDGYQNVISQHELDDLREYDLISEDIESYKIYAYDSKQSLISTLSTTVQTPAKLIVISKSCSDKCIVTLTEKWLKTPNVKSWDVIGLRLEDCTIVSRYQGSISGTGSSTVYTNPKTFTNGFGYSLKVPNTTNIVATTGALVTKGGTVFGSYQHAKSVVTENQSKRYTLSRGGQGSVFLFDSTTIDGKYDDTSGVNITT